MVAAKSDTKTPEIDMSLSNWIYNTRSMLHFPFAVVTVALLLISGTFTETASRKSLEPLDSTLGHIVLFMLPLCIAYTIDWPTGVLAATVSLIVFAKLQGSDTEEGFADSFNSGNNDVTTKIISNSHRWFVEKILGESPLAISSDRIHTTAVQSENQRSSSNTGQTSQVSLTDSLLSTSSSNK